MDGTSPGLPAPIDLSSTLPGLGEGLQQMREGGFRPVVFLGHGLLTAFLIMTATVAAAAFWRTRTRVFQLPASGLTNYLGGVLILCKTLGALLYGAVSVLLVRFTRPQLQLRIAVALVAVAP